MLRKLSLAGGTLALVAVLAIPVAQAAPVDLSAKLKGSKEVPGPGDRNGKGEAAIKVKKAKKKVCFVIEFEKIADPTAAHIHRGGPDVAGPVKVLLFEDPAGVPGPTVEGCVDTTRKLARRIARRPERFYVNVHNEEFPDGAIRGQLDFAR